MSEFLARHGAHIIVLGGPIVVLAGMFVVLELTKPERARARQTVLTRVLALAWAAVATTHLTVIKEHFGESPVLGSFFLVLSLVQYGYAVALLVHVTRRLLVLGLIANTSVILLWTYTRVVAIPFGLGGREPVGAVDLLATALEIGTVVVTLLVLTTATGALSAPESRRTTPRPRRAWPGSPRRRGYGLVPEPLLVAAAGRTRESEDELC